MVKKLPKNPKDIVGSKKPDLTLVPASAIIALAVALKNGAEKYGAYNWRARPVETRTYLAATLRHTMAYLDGEELAEDSGIPHLWHAMASLAVIIDAIETDHSIDNRPTKGAAAGLIKEWTDYDNV